MAQAQNLYLKANGSAPHETAVIDSIPYTKAHENAKSVADEATRLLTTLRETGYLEARKISHSKANDSLFVYIFETGSKTNTISINTTKLSAEQKALLNISTDTIRLPVTETAGFMQRKLALLEKSGYSLSTLQLKDYERDGKNLNAALYVVTEKKRTLDGLVIEGYTKFPEGIRRGILKKYKGRTFNKDNLQRLYADFNNIRFVSQVRYPEILFKEDTTKVYAYLEKAKPNSFDGFIGFSNDADAGRVRFNGYLDLLLINVLNTGERFNLYWKNNGEEQTTFNTELELPYIFKSPIGLRAQLNIFKQDSTFQNTVTDLSAGYYFSYNSKVFVGYRKTQSVDIQNLNSATVSDFESRFWTGSYDFTGYSTNDFLFPEKSRIFLKSGIGKRTTKTGEAAQYYIQGDIWHNLYLNSRNIINIRSETFYLKSNDYIVNELYRFGGINSFRGFNDNSLQASFYSAILAEYRYVLATGMYVYSITDYGYFQDKASELNDKLLGFGAGFGILTKTGLFKLVYANGSNSGTAVKLSNSIVHLSYKARF